MSGQILVPLTCPACGGELEGGSQSLVFICRPCSMAMHCSDLARGYPLRYAVPVIRKSRPDLHAPFWRVKGTFSWRAKEPAKERAYANQRPLGPLFVPAFWSPKAVYCDNFTLRYAQAGVAIELSGGDAPVLDGSRAPSVLGELSRLTWLAYLDRVADVTGVEGRFDVEDVSYVAIPFYLEGEHYQDGILGAQAPAAFFSL